MIPILYESNETAFATNGLGRLRDCISCKVTEERNGIYECDFDYPVDGAHFDLIQCGRIIAVTHNDTGDVQPFDIIGYSKPINGVVTFHCVHISYRLNGATLLLNSGYDSISTAFAKFATAHMASQFSFESDFDSTGYIAAADGIPRTVRQLLGGIEGSILDTFGGEYEWDKFKVILHKNRGTKRDFSIRYGLNMVDYNEEVDFSESYTVCIPYWTNGEEKVVATRTTINLPRWCGRDVCVPMDLSDKFDSKPTTTQLRTMAQQMLASKSPHLPKQNINVDFIRLQDVGEYERFESLLQCRLCDSIDVVFPRYGMAGTYKIVKTEYDVLSDRYISLELGSLQVTLSEALGLGGKR